VTVVFSGSLRVHYGQAYVVPSHTVAPDFRKAFQGQTNGLRGAAVPGRLVLITGLHTGHVGFTVEVNETASLIDDVWEEVVEVPFRVTNPNLVLLDWFGTAHPLPLPAGRYRARYCARGMQVGRELDTSPPGEGDPVDFYALALWPSLSIEDQVIRQTSEIAAYWHHQVSSRHR
jgi:hypothetical protein